MLRHIDVINENNGKIMTFYETIQMIYHLKGNDENLPKN